MLGAFINLQNIFKVCYPISLFIYNINKNDIMTLLRNYYTNRYEIFREYQNCYREELSRSLAFIGNFIQNFGFQGANLG